MKLGTRRQLLGWAAATHLLVALVYSTHLQVEDFIPPAIERAMQVYGNYSGAHMHFNLFAPTVVTQARVEFRLGAGENVLRTVKVTSDSGEVNVRLATMFNFYLLPRVRKALVDEWSRRVLAANPDAEWVQTYVEVLYIPTLEQMKAGQRVEWVEFGRHGAVRGPAAVR